jgi:uncharacterized protein YggE
MNDQNEGYRRTNMNDKKALSWKLLAPVGMLLLGIVVIATSCAGTSGGGVVAPQQNGSAGGSVINTISVTGTGQSFGTPDIADIQLGIDVSDAEVGAAIEKANTVMAAVQAAVKEQGVEDADMQTVNFNVYPEDIYDRETGQPTGERRYHVNNFLNVKVRDISKVGAIIDAGLTAGATNVSGLSFGVDDTSALEAEARTNALKDAEERAKQLAAGVGVTLGKPIIVTEILSGPVYPMPVFAAAADGKGAAAPAISVGQQAVSIQVNVTYAISQ